MNQDLLYKYFKGNATIEEEKQILDWLKHGNKIKKQYKKSVCINEYPI